MTGTTVQSRAVPLQTCRLREPLPCLRATHRQARQVDILLDKGMVGPYSCIPATSSYKPRQTPVSPCPPVTDGGNLLLLDEPTNHLDLASQEILEEALLSYEGTIIPVSHDRTLLGAVSTQVWEIKEGRLSVFTENYDRYKKRIAAEQAQAQANAGQKKRRSSKKRDQDREGKRQGDMSVLEREIEQLESKLKQVEEGLLAASFSGDQKKMARLGKEHG